MGNVIEYQEAHGSVAVFETDVIKKIKNLTVNINPIQSGSGDPSPDNVRSINGWTETKVIQTGKNILNLNNNSLLYNYRNNIVIDGTNDLHVTKALSDGIIRPWATAQLRFATFKGPMTIVFSGKYNNPNLDASAYIAIGCVDNPYSTSNSPVTHLNSLSYIKDVGNGTFVLPCTIPDGKYLCLYFAMASLSTNYTITGDFVLNDLQLEIGTTATTYGIYQGYTYDITFPSKAGMVYGGTLNITNGTLTVNKALVTKSGDDLHSVVAVGRYYCDIGTTGTFVADSENISNMFMYSISSAIKEGQCYMQSGFRVQIQTPYETLDDFKAALGNNLIEFCFKLATPITYTLTPQEIQTIIGSNAIYANTGDVSVYYPKTNIPVETLSKINLFDLRKNIIIFSQMKSKPTIKTYGVEWNYADPSTVLKRTGAAKNFTNPVPAESLSEIGWSPFDNVYPWSEMKRYNIINGEVAYSEDDAGYSETDYDTVVYIPEFYYHANKNTINQKWNWSISANPLDGYEKHPGSGCYVGRFHTSGSSTAVYSKSNTSVCTNYSITNFRKYSHNKGKDWWQIDLATWSAIQILYLVEFANWNSQSVLGKGNNTINVSKTGGTTGAAYHTLKRTGVNGNTYRWIENLYSNRSTFVDGFKLSSGIVYISTNNSNFDTSITNMTSTNIKISNGYITDFGYSNVFPWAFISIKGSGSSTTYITDTVGTTYDGDIRVGCFGGDSSDNSEMGLFYINAWDVQSYKSLYRGSRLIFKP